MHEGGGGCLFTLTARNPLLIPILFHEESCDVPISADSVPHLCASQFQPRTSPSRANPGNMIRDESRGAGHLVVNSVPAPGHLQTTTNLLPNILSSFPTALRKSRVILDVEEQFSTIKELQIQ